MHLTLLINGRGGHGGAKGFRASIPDQKVGRLGGPFVSTVISKHSFQIFRAWNPPLKYNVHIKFVSCKKCKFPHLSCFQVVPHWMVTGENGRHGVRVKIQLTLKLELDNVTTRLLTAEEHLVLHLQPILPCVVSFPDRQQGIFCIIIKNQEKPPYEHLYFCKDFCHQWNSIS